MKCFFFRHRHADGKRTDRNYTSRINVAQSIAIDHQLRLAYNLSEDLHLKNIIQTGSCDKFQTCQFDNVYIVHNWVIYNGNLYKTEKCVVFTSIEDDLLKFGLVTAIFVKVAILVDKILCACKHIVIIGFDKHRHSYNSSSVLCCAKLSIS